MKYLLVLFFFVFSCTKIDNEKDFSLSLEIEGLKKGIVYLEKISDSSMVVIDSVLYNGNKSIQFQGKIDEPEIMIISLTFGNEPDPKRFPFFMEKSNIILKTRLKDFGFKVDSKGSKNDSIYRQYLEINKKFNNEKLDLISKSLGFQKSGNKDSISFYDSKLEKLILIFHHLGRSGGSSINDLLKRTEEFSNRKLMFTGVFKNMSR